ncbi:MAG: CesT family type III secretion system chaperone [Planctomycetota bacterium]
MAATVTTEMIESEIERLRDTKLDREDANQVVRELGEIIGIEDLQLDEEGVAELIIDGQVELSLVHLPELPGIIAAAALPEGMEADPAVLRQILATNLSWQATQGGCFTFVEPRLAICRLIPLGPGQSELLDQELARFVHRARAWQEMLGQEEVAEASDDSGNEDVGVRV